MSGPRKVLMSFAAREAVLALIDQAGHLVSKAKHRQGEKMAITIQPYDEGATLSLGTEFTAERVVIRTCGQRIDLPVLQGEYPNWRRLQLGIDDRERVDAMVLAPSILAAVGKLVGVRAVRLAFHGKTKQIQIEAAEDPDGLAKVRGLLMPMRWTDPEPDKQKTQRPRREKPALSLVG